MRGAVDWRNRSQRQAAVRRTHEERGSNERIAACHGVAARRPAGASFGEAPSARHLSSGPGEFPGGSRRRPPSSAPPSPLAGRLSARSLLFAFGEGTFLTGSVVFVTRIVGLPAAQVCLGLTCAGIAAVTPNSAPGVRVRRAAVRAQVMGLESVVRTCSRQRTGCVPPATTPPFGPQAGPRRITPESWVAPRVRDSWRDGHSAGWWNPAASPRRPRDRGSRRPEEPPGPRPR